MSQLMLDLGIDRLSRDERVKLVFEIWDSLEELPVAPSLSEAQWAEIERRDAEMDANPGMGRTWEQVRARMEGRS